MGSETSCKLLASLALLTIHLAQVLSSLSFIPFHLNKQIINNRVIINGCQVDGSQLRDLKVQCSRSGLTVHVKFDQPFNGIIFSQNFYQVPQCTYVTSDNNGHSSYRYCIFQDTLCTCKSNYN